MFWPDARWLAKYSKTMGIIIDKDRRAGPDFKKLQRLYNFLIRARPVHYMHT